MPCSRASCAYKPPFFRSSSGCPISIIFPCSRTITLFTFRARITPSRCVTITMLFIFSMADEIAPTTVFSLFESSAAVGSSKRRTSGDPMSARAIATRCLCPPERVRPPSPTRVSSSSPRSLLSPVTGSPAKLSASSTRVR
mmetsp:Transcript_12530/g.22713  ORF Transcript_12530/g.22713 Transcript_12530/m.22713 type:complete len:141 (-) Transcript_12530:181-603(-)